MNAEGSYRQLSCCAVQKVHLLIVLKERELALLQVLIKAGADQAL